MLITKIISIFPGKFAFSSLKVLRRLKSFALLTREVPEPYSELFEWDLPQSIEHPGFTVWNFCGICCGALGDEIKRLKVLNFISNPKKKQAMPKYCGWVPVYNCACSCGFEPHRGSDFLFSLKFKHFLIIIFLLIKALQIKKNIFLESAFDTESNDICKS